MRTGRRPGAGSVRSTARPRCRSTSPMRATRATRGPTRTAATSATANGITGKRLRTPLTHLRRVAGMPASWARRSQDTYVEPTHLPVLRLLSRVRALTGQAAEQRQWAPILSGGGRGRGDQQGTSCGADPASHSSKSPGSLDPPNDRPGRPFEFIGSTARASSCCSGPIERGHGSAGIASKGSCRSSRVNGAGSALVAATMSIASPGLSMPT